MDHPARVELAKLVLQTNLGPFELGWKSEADTNNLPVFLVYQMKPKIRQWRWRILGTYTNIEYGL